MCIYIYTYGNFFRFSQLFVTFIIVSLAHILKKRTTSIYIQLSILGATIRIIWSILKREE